MAPLPARCHGSANVRHGRARSLERGSLMVRGVRAGLSMIIVPAGLFAQAQTQAPGRIFLANDEWPLTNVGFQQASDTGTFISNVLSWFKPGGAGKFHAYSRNLGLTGSLLAKAITDGGHAWTTGLN